MLVLFTTQVISNWSKLKAYAYNRINATVEHKFVVRRGENIVEKGDNAGYQKKKRKRKEKQPTASLSNDC